MKVYRTWQWSLFENNLLVQTSWHAIESKILQYFVIFARKELALLNTRVITAKIHIAFRTFYPSTDSNRYLDQQRSQTCFLPAMPIGMQILTSRFFGRKIVDRKRIQSSWDRPAIQPHLQQASESDCSGVRSLKVPWNTVKPVPLHLRRREPLRLPLRSSRALLFTATTSSLSMTIESHAKTFTTALSKLCIDACLSVIQCNAWKAHSKYRGHKNQREKFPLLSLEPQSREHNTIS